MRNSFRRAALKIVCLLCSIAPMALSGAHAEDQRHRTPSSAASRQFFPVKQAPLTEKQILGVLDAADEIKVITDSAPENIDELRPDTIAKLDAVARKHGLASYASS